MKLSELSVADVMTTAVVTLRSSDAIEEADLAMRVAEFRHLPVVDEHHRLVGILSDRDLLRHQGRGRRGKVAIGEAMTRRPEFARPDEPARTAAARLLEHKIGALPVVDDEEQVVGIVTETDLLRVAWIPGTR